MIDLTRAVKPGKATISTIGNQVLPTVLRVDQVVAFCVAAVVGLLLGGVLFGGVLPLVLAVLFGVGAVAALTWEDKGGNNIVVRLRLIYSHRTNSVHKHLDSVTGEKDSVKGHKFYVGAVEIKDITHGFVRLQASSAAVAPGSVDKDGVHVSKLA
jgi:hypothetical protein